MAAPIGNWQKELEIWLKQYTTNRKHASFETCNTDEERIFNIMKENHIDDVQWISAYFDKCHEIHQKSVNRASKLRQDGNKYFQRKQFREAASMYTQAILDAPIHSEELSLAYGNRSAVLLHLESFNECLADIHEATVQGFPESLRYKLLVRRLHCLKNIGQAEQFQNCIPEAREAIETSDCDPKRKDKLLKEIKDLEVKEMNRKVSEEADSLPAVVNGHSQVLIQASAAVSLQFNDTQGRFLTTSQDIKAGDTLIMERPFTAVLLPEHYPTHCHHCYVKQTYSFPCRQCSQVRYCSPSCAAASWQSYHHIECPYLLLLHSVGIAHLSLRVVLVAGLEFLKDFRRKQTPPPSNKECVPGLDDNGQYCRSYQTVYDLMTHTDHMETEDLLQYTMTACLLLRVLQHSRWFDNKSHGSNCRGRSSHEQNQTSNDGFGNAGGICWQSDKSVDQYRDKEKQGNICHNINESKNSLLDETCFSLKERCVVMDNDEQENCCELDVSDPGGQSAEELYVGGLLLRHIQQLVCNAHAITELQCSQASVDSIVEDFSQVRIATAIYPTASLMNHSCDPSIISSFHKDILVVRAVKDVPTGGEIFNCYGPHHKRMSFTERQKSLKEQYFFTCQCLPCTEGEKADAILYSFKCPVCAGPLVPSTPSGYICRECQHRSATVDSEKERLAADHFYRAVTLLQENKVKDALQLMKKCCKIRTELLYRYNKDLSEAQDCLARCYAMLGHFVEAASHLRTSIETVKVIYGESSIETANELQKLSELLISAQSWVESLNVVQEAISVFTLHYGNTHDVVRGLMAAEEQLLDVIGK